MIDTTVKFLEREVKLLEQIHSQINKSTNGTDVAFSLLVYGIIDSSKTLLSLIPGRKLRDSYMIARSIFESCLNIGYFSVKGEGTIEKAYNHSLSKSYRDLRRTVEVGDIKLFIGLSENAKVMKHQRLVEALSEFTNDKGHEIRAWTGDNTFKKIELIDSKFGKGISMPYTLCLYYIYRHSSEILHGTIFGAMFALGMTQERNAWPNNNEEFDKYYNHRLTLLGQSIILLLSRVVYIIGEHVDIKAIREENHTIIKEYRAFIEQIK